MKPIKPIAWTGGRPWIISVFLLSLPSVIFVFLHLLYAPGRLPEFLDLMVTWTITLTAMMSAVTTSAACVVAVIASFQPYLPGTAKVAMWAFASASLLACCYLTTVPL
jgi:hypothetical protein